MADRYFYQYHPDAIRNGPAIGGGGINGAPGQYYHSPPPPSPSPISTGPSQNHSSTNSAVQYVPLPLSSPTTGFGNYRYYSGYDSYGQPFVSNLNPLAKEFYPTPVRNARNGYKRPVSSIVRDLGIGRESENRSNYEYRTGYARSISRGVSMAAGPGGYMTRNSDSTAYINTTWKRSNTILPVLKQQNSNENDSAGVGTQSSYYEERAMSSDNITEPGSYCSALSEVPLNRGKNQDYSNIQRIEGGTGMETEETMKEKTTIKFYGPFKNTDPRKNQVFMLYPTKQQNPNLAADSQESVFAEPLPIVYSSKDCFITKSQSSSVIDLKGTYVSFHPTEIEKDKAKEESVASQATTASAPVEESQEAAEEVELSETTSSTDNIKTVTTKVKNNNSTKTEDLEDFDRSEKSAKSAKTIVRNEKFKTPTKKLHQPSFPTWKLPPKAEELKFNKPCSSTFGIRAEIRELPTTSRMIRSWEARAQANNTDVAKAEKSVKTGQKPSVASGIAAPRKEAFVLPKGSVNAYAAKGQEQKPETGHRNGILRKFHEPKKTTEAEDIKSTDRSSDPYDNKNRSKSAGPKLKGVLINNKPITHEFQEETPVKKPIVHKATIKPQMVNKTTTPPVSPTKKCDISHNIGKHETESRFKSPVDNHGATHGAIPKHSKLTTQNLLKHESNSLKGVKTMEAAAGGKSQVKGSQSCMAISIADKRNKSASPSKMTHVLHGKTKHETTETKGINHTLENTRGTLSKLHKQQLAKKQPKHETSSLKGVIVDKLGDGGDNARTKMSRSWDHLTNKSNIE